MVSSLDFVLLKVEVILVEGVDGEATYLIALGD